MKNVTVWLKQNPLYAVAGLVLAATLFSAGCQPTAMYRGEEVNADQLEVRRQSDLRKIESEIRSLQADAVGINAEAALTAAEIDRKETVIAEGLAFVGNLITTAATGGVINADDTVKGGLSLVTLLLGGGYLRQRVAKKAEDKGYDMGRTEGIQTINAAK